VKKNDPSSLTKSEIAKEILAYLGDHPDAQDTLEGIVQWWLLERRVKSQTKLISAALEELIEKQFVHEHRARDARTYYRVDNRRPRKVRATNKKLPRE
jgi:hypothetical protein